MPRPRKRKSNSEVRAITLNSPTIVLDCYCDIMRICKCTERTSKESLAGKQADSKDIQERILRNPEIK